MFADEDLREAESYPVLGPAYFDAQRVAAKVMEKFEAEHFKPVIDKLSQEVTDRLWDDLQSSLLYDTEMNLQGEMWRMVDNCVQALLTGDSWALKRYALADRHDGEKIREAVARHIPTELQDTRVADLEKEVMRLRNDLKFYRDR